MKDRTDTPALSVDLLGLGLLGPGLADWPRGAPLLAEPSTWQPAATVVPGPQRLPPTERRRAGTVVKAAMVVADEACATAALAPHELATVFTSSTGDPANCHALCEALATPDRLVSPTRFTNSVHNAPSGYWHIATQCMQASTSLAGFDASFAAGLVEAAVQAQASGRPVLLVACDVPYPEPLHRLRPVSDTMAVAMVLAPAAAALPSGEGAGATTSAPRIRLSIALGTGSDGDASPTPCDHAGLEALRHGIPAGRALPLLMALAQAQLGQPDPAGPADLTARGRVTARTIVVDGWGDLAVRVDLGPSSASAACA